MNRLKAYVRRTMLASAKEYSYPAKRRTIEGTRSMCMDATRGTDTGWWRDMIYNGDVIALFDRYRTDVAAAITEYWRESGMNLAESPYSMRDACSFAEMIASTARRQKPRLPESWADMDAETCCAMRAVRCAVEYLAGEVARDLVPDL